MEEGQIIALILTPILAYLFGLIGKKRRIGFGWAFVSVLFLGFIGMIIVLCSKKKGIDFVDIEKRGGEQ